MFANANALALALALATPSLHGAAFPIRAATSFGGATSTSNPRKRTHRHNSRPSQQLLVSTSGGSYDKDRPWQFHVAPMQGYTSHPLRKLFRCLSLGDEFDDGDSSVVLWTEMEKVEDLLGVNQNGWEKRFGSPNRSGESRDSCILQLGGSDPDLVKQCIYRAAEYGYTPFDFRGINLNCGCPSIESGGAATYGASLMRKPGLTRQLVEAVSETVDSLWGEDCGVDVSVKTRIAVVDTAEDLLCATIEGEQNILHLSSAGWTLDEEQYAFLKQYVTQIQKGGADHVILHARPAVLAGLSPVKNRIVPQLDHSVVERVANDFPGMRLTLNGGIISFADLKSVVNGTSEGSNGRGGVASHMAGRWMLRRPCDLALVTSQCLASRGQQPTDIDVIAAIESYINYIEQALDRLDRGDAATPTQAELFLPLYLVVEQLREDYDSHCESMDLDGEISGQLLSMESIEDIYGTIVAYLLQVEGGRRGGRGKKSKIPAADEHNFKKLAASFKGIVGTKVASKWRRNRAEL
jgi:tRNA-dihydrouridine synthase